MLNISVMVKNHLLILVLMFFNTFLHAQEIEANSELVEDGEYFDESGHVNFVNFNVGAIYAQNAFKRYVSKPKILYQTSFYRQVIKEQPWFMGFQLSYAQIDKLNASVRMPIEFGFEIWSSSTSSSLKSFSLVNRFYLPLKIPKLEVFSEFNLGTNWFSTITTLTPPNTEESGNGVFDKNDLSANYGLALGLHVPISSNSYIQLRLGYIAGLSSFYYTRSLSGAAPVFNTIEVFDLHKSSTDMGFWDLGYTFAF